MQVIEDLLRQSGERILYATAAGKRCHPGNAYKADGTVLSVQDAAAQGHDSEDVQYTPLPGGVDIHSIVWVECAIPGIPRTRIVDHHRPGDPGYGAPPEDFLRASSIGQVVSLLARDGIAPLSPQALSPVPDDLPDGEWRYYPHWGYPTSPAGIQGGVYKLAYTATLTRTTGRGDPDSWSLGRSEAMSAYTYQERRWAACLGARPDTPYTWYGKQHLSEGRLHDIVACAAADHCLAHAYGGECPGVDPDKLMQWRAESRAKFQGRDVSAVLADVETARAKLAKAPPMYVRGVTVRDMRGAGHVPELPEASARDGRPFVASLQGRDGRTKIVVQSAPPEVVQAFLDGEVVEGLTDTYGDPARGFAGGYLPERHSDCPECRSHLWDKNTCPSCGHNGV
jgi:hypothetical protein